MNARRVGLFGGSFNPPHNGHVAAAARAAGALALDTLVVMPAGTPPHKSLPPGSPGPADRLAMTRLAFANLPGCAVSDWECRRPETTYTAVTLSWLRGKGFQPVLIVGSDMFLTLHEWMRAEEILSSTRIAVLIRAGGQAGPARRQAAFLAHRYDAAVDWVEHDPVEVSSTELRAALRLGGGREWLPGAVYAYIAANRLYGVKTDDA